MANVEHVLVITTLFYAVSIVIVYIAAVAQGHVYYFFPYVSDVGSTAPESAFFSLVLNFFAVEAAVFVFIRGRYLLLALDKTSLGDDKRLKKTIKINTWIGVVGSLFQTAIASIPVGLDHLFVPHQIAGNFLFILLTAMAVIDASYISHKIMPELCSKRMAKIRLMVAICLILIPFLIFYVTACISFPQFDGENVVYWTPRNKAYTLHVVSTISEWIMIFSIGIYLLTFYPDMKELSIVGLQVKLRNEGNNQPNGFSTEIPRPTGSVWDKEAPSSLM